MSQKTWKPAFNPINFGCGQLRREEPAFLPPFRIVQGVCGPRSDRFDAARLLWWIKARACQPAGWAQGWATGCQRQAGTGQAGSPLLSRAWSFISGIQTLSNGGQRDPAQAGRRCLIQAVQRKVPGYNRWSQTDWARATWTRYATPATNLSLAHQCTKSSSRAHVAADVSDWIGCGAWTGRQPDLRSQRKPIVDIVFIQNSVPSE